MKFDKEEFVLNPLRQVSKPVVVLHVSTSVNLDDIGDFDNFSICGGCALFVIFFF